MKLWEPEMVAKLSVNSSKALNLAGRVRPNVRQIAVEICLLVQDSPYPDLTVIWGLVPSSKPEHSAGTALDFMSFNTPPVGQYIADYLWVNRVRLGLRWEIWRQHIRSTTPGKPGGWQQMADRGSVTANHYDHVHANFWVKPYQPPGGGSVAEARNSWYAGNYDGKPWVPYLDLTWAVEAAWKAGKYLKSPEGVATQKQITASLTALGMADSATFKRLQAARHSKSNPALRMRDLYAAWQHHLGLSGGDALDPHERPGNADGIPGWDSLNVLGRRIGLRVRR